MASTIKYFDTLEDKSTPTTRTFDMNVDGTPVILTIKVATSSLSPKGDRELAEHELLQALEAWLKSHPKV